MIDHVEQAVDVLRRGGLIVFPTDTVYGVGTALSSQEGVRRLYQIKQRPLSQPTALLCSPKYAFIRETLVRPDGESYKRLIEAFWPGSLTIVFPLSAKHKELAQIQIVSAGHGSIGIRYPDHPFVKSLLECLDEPLVATSANPRGGITPVSFDQVDQTIVDAADLAIRGQSTLGVESTVLDVSRSPWQVLRHGQISLEQIREAVPDQEVV